MFRTPALACPSCGATLRRFARRLACDACGGLLIALDDLAAQLAAEVAAVPREGDAAACPRCTGPAPRVELRVGGRPLQGTVAACPRDGLWLPAGALAAVLLEASRRHGHVAGGHGYGGDRTVRLAFDARARRRRPIADPPISALGGRPLACPACAAALAADGPRWTCATCRGVFVEDAVLVRLMTDMCGRPWPLPAPAGAAGARSCPACGQAMRVDRLHGVAVDRCGDHGVWFDADELERALHDAAR
jgi:Zn-finger nucleic acid-binding protein